MQTPFITIFAYLNEAKNEQEKKDLAMIIEEVLKQRIQGVKNEVGVWITPAFPKIIYALEEDNCKEGTKYWWLTELAAKCTAKRMVPDYISEKKMLELKGTSFPSMGCVEGNELITYKYKNDLYVESFKRMWNRLSRDFDQKHQYTEDNPNLYMDVENVEIYDTKQGFVKTLRVIRNVSTKWMRIRLASGRVIDCTEDHPFETQRGTVFAKDLTTDDEMTINNSQYVGSSKYNYTDEQAWMYGVLLCDSAISSGVMGSFAKTGENELIEYLCNAASKVYPNSTSKVRLVDYGERGNYKTVRITGNEIQYDLITKFDGIPKKDRHIPNELFSMNESARLNFLAGLIDADGYICDYGTISRVQLGSVNKELALQEAALMRSLGMVASVYTNHYSSKRPEAIAYRVECIPTEQLVSLIKCEKKRNYFTKKERSNDSCLGKDVVKVTKIEFLKDHEDFSYDVTTDSEHFEVNGIYSHNCRSFLSPWHDELDIQSNEQFDLLEDSNHNRIYTKDLWNQLIEQGYKPENNKIVLKKDVYVNHKILNGTIQKCKVEYLIKDSEINEITAHIRTKDLFYGRFNQGVVTVNLPYIALLAYRNIQPKHDVQKKLTDQQRKDQLEEFWKVFDQYLGIAHKALQARHSRLLNTPVETSPLHWMYGGIARLEKGETINKLLFGGYSTISLGYAGLYECIQALTGKSHTDPEANKLAMDIMQHLNDCCEKWKKEENIGYSVYGSPIESTTYKFAKALQREFGKVPEVSDHEYITNSYHVNVREHIDPFKKLALESKFQELSQGGCISYVETANLQNNIPAVLEVIKFIYENIMYAELNTKSDYCQVCGSTDEIKIVEENGKLIWECPHCGNRDQAKMNVARRTCGYIGQNFWNSGRTYEIKQRYVHLGEDDNLDLENS